MFIKKNINILIIIILILEFALSNIIFAQNDSIKKFKILHVMSYHDGWEWSDEQFKGFKDALKGLNIEYKIFEMDTKRNSSIQWKNQIGKKARELIDSLHPDLVYTSDDNAQEYVAKYYANKNIPFVFSGVNSDPKVYGFTGSKNITGTIEREHVVETVKLLKEIVPGIKKIVVIIDIDITWVDIAKRIKELVPQYFPDIEVMTPPPIRTFVEYKYKIKEYQTTADAIALLGIYAFEDEKGKDVPFDIVLKWTAENSNLPDFTFWDDRVYYGTFCAVALSGYEQGLSAGKLARKILIENASPSNLIVNPTIKGKPIINLARAKKLGINIKSTILLTAQIVPQFEWDKK